MWNKKSKEEKKKIREEKREERRSRPGTFYGVLRLGKILFKKRDYNIEERKVTKEDKKAILSYTYDLVNYLEDNDYEILYKEEIDNYIA